MTQAAIASGIGNSMLEKDGATTRTVKAERGYGRPWKLGAHVFFSEISMYARSVDVLV
jgi:hypothetical protein